MEPNNIGPGETGQEKVSSGGGTGSARAAVAMGASYEGRDPALFELMLPHLDYIEVTPETIAEVDDGKIRLSPEVMCELKNAAKNVKIIVHGVSLSIGSHEGWASNYFQLLDELFSHLDVAWHSEHLGYTKVDEEHLGIMLAMPKSACALDMIAERISKIQDRYPIPFLIENIVHVLPDFASDYSDAGFLNALTERTGCGLILDLYNLECDAHNIGFDIAAFLKELNKQPVRELHLARGVVHNGFLLDVHSQLTRDSTVGLARQLIADQARNVEVAVFEFMPEAIPGLGRGAIANELCRLRAALRS